MFSISLFFNSSFSNSRTPVSFRQISKHSILVLSLALTAGVQSAYAQNGPGGGGNHHGNHNDHSTKQQWDRGQNYTPPSQVGTDASNEFQSEDVPVQPPPPPASNPVTPTTPTLPGNCKAMFFFFLNHRGSSAASNYGAGGSRYLRNGQNISNTDDVSDFTAWVSDYGAAGYPNDQNYEDFFAFTSCPTRSPGYSPQNSSCAETKNLESLPNAALRLWIDPCNRSTDFNCRGNEDDIPETYTFTGSDGVARTFRILSGPLSYNNPPQIIFSNLNDPNGACVMGINAGLVSPLVIDLNNEGVKFTDTGSNVKYDFGYGLRATHWIANTKSVALLALDLNRNGTIDNFAELFGDRTPGPDAKGADDGFLTLSKYDDHKDGRIDKQDKVYKNLLVWNDLNGDAVSQADELQPLSAVHVASIDLNYNNKMISHDRAGNVVKGSSRATLDNGQTRAIYDVWFTGAEEYSVKGASSVVVPPTAVPQPGSPAFEAVQKVYKQTLTSGEFAPNEFEYNNGKQRTFYDDAGKISGYELRWPHKADRCTAIATFGPDWSVKKSLVQCS